MNHSRTTCTEVSDTVIVRIRWTKKRKRKNGKRNTEKNKRPLSSFTDMLYVSLWLAENSRYHASQTDRSGWLLNDLLVQFLDIRSTGITFCVDATIIKIRNRTLDSQKYSAESNPIVISTHELALYHTLMTSIWDSDEAGVDAGNQCLLVLLGMNKWSHTRTFTFIQ